jgi:hypothetical protein
VPDLPVSSADQIINQVHKNCVLLDKNYLPTEAKVGNQTERQHHVDRPGRLNTVRGWLRLRALLDEPVALVTLRKFRVFKPVAKPLL